MKRFIIFIILLLIIGASIVFANMQSRPTELKFVGTHEDIGGKFFPVYKFPQASIVPWRSASADNTYDSDGDGDDYYGTAGFILFATQFGFPDANPPDSSNSKIGKQGDFKNPTGDSSFPNLVDLPEFITDWEILAPRMFGGFSYALVDDPRKTLGQRRWTFDGTSYPLPTKDNTTGVVPFVKIGILTGSYLDPKKPKSRVPEDRWSFTVGGDVPSSIRLGVMTDGLDNPNMAPGTIILRKVVPEDANTKPIQVSASVSNGNRFVDIHFFDIVNAQAGDRFIISAAPSTKGHGAAISGFCFDINTPKEK